MIRSLWCKVGANLKSTTINGQSSPAAAANRYIFFTFQNPIVVDKSRVSSIFYLYSTSNNLSSSSSASASDSSFGVSYLINSCGLSENQAITVYKKIDFKSTSKPDSVVELFENYGFTKPYISKIIAKRPFFLLSNPLKTLKPKLDFFNSKGVNGIELADFISRNPSVLAVSLKGTIIPSFDILKRLVHTDTNTIRILGRYSSWVLGIGKLKTLMVHIESLRNEGVPQSNIFKWLIRKPSVFMGNADRFKKTVKKVKGLGFDPSRITFVVALEVLTSMSEVTWERKVDFCKRWGWSEDQIQTAFRRSPLYMNVSEKKLTAVKDFLVKEMGYDSFSIAEYPGIFTYSLKERIIPRCSVIRILVSKGLIEKKLSLWSLSSMMDKSFSDKFVKPYEQEAPELMQIYIARAVDLPRATSEMKDLKI